MCVSVLDSFTGTKSVKICQILITVSQYATESAACYDQRKRKTVLYLGPPEDLCLFSSGWRQ